MGQILLGDEFRDSRGRCFKPLDHPRPAGQLAGKIIVSPTTGCFRQFLLEHGSNRGLIPNIFIVAAGTGKMGMKLNCPDPFFSGYSAIDEVRARGVEAGVERQQFENRGHRFESIHGDIPVEQLGEHREKANIGSGIDHDVTILQRHPMAQVNALLEHLPIEGLRFDPGLFHHGQIVGQCGARPSADAG